MSRKRTDPAYSHESPRAPIAVPTSRNTKLLAPPRTRDQVPNTTMWIHPAAQAGHSKPRPFGLILGMRTSRGCDRARERMRSRDAFDQGKHEGHGALGTLAGVLPGG
jgi:hypothetical protein